MIKITIKSENAEGIREQLEALLGVYGGAKDLNVGVVPPEPKKRKKVEAPKAEPAKAEPAKAEPAKEEPAKEEPAKEEPEGELATTSGESVTKDLIIEVMVEKSRSGKKAEMKSLLEEFGAKRVGEIKEAEYEAFYAKLTEL